MIPAFHNPAWFRPSGYQIIHRLILGYTSYFILRTLFGSRRAADIRLRARHQKNGLTSDVLCSCVVVGIALGVILHGLTTDYNGSELIHTAQAATTTPIAKEVRIAVEIEWTRERIIKEIRDTFPETPDLAVKIAKCESNLIADIQSGHTLSYGRERSFGIFQAHEPVWGKYADRHFPDWRTDPADNIALARYIYDQSGKTWTAWSCYTKKMI